MVPNLALVVLRVDNLAARDACEAHLVVFDVVGALARLCKVDCLVAPRALRTRTSEMRTFSTSLLCQHLGGRGRE